MSVGIGRERQFEVYVGGARGVYPRVPVSFERLERAARGAMSPEGFAYVAGGAGTEETMRENRAAFERWRIVPRDAPRRLDARHGRRGARHAARRARSCSARSACSRWRTATPTSRSRARPRPRASRSIFSNQASRPMEETARAMGDAPRWFQLYWSTSDELVASLVSRAERVRLLGDRAHARHDDARLADPRPRPRVPARSCAGRASRSTRATRCSSRRCRRRCARRRRPAAASRSPRIGTLSEPGRRVSRVAARERALGPRARGRPSLRRDLLAAVALLGRPRVPPRAHDACRSC